MQDLASSSSSSEAPLLAAAALRDNVVRELTEENRRLRKKLGDRSLLQITGRGGFPVYCEAPVLEAGGLYVPEMGEQSDWFVHMLPPRPRNETDTEVVVGGGGGGDRRHRRLPWRTFERDLEIKLGGIVLRTKNNQPLYFDEDVSSCNGHRFSFGYVHPGPVRKIEGVLLTPPKGEEEGGNRDTTGTVRSGMSKLERLARSQDVEIEGVLFDQKAIRDLINGGDGN